LLLPLPLLLLSLLLLMLLSQLLLLWNFRLQALPLLQCFATDMH
jgi:hypothetical protein